MLTLPSIVRTPPTGRLRGDEKRRKNNIIV